MKNTIALFFCFGLIANGAYGQAAAFTVPDTVCVNTKVTIKNNSTGATTYFWNFCEANGSSTPVFSPLGNPGALLSMPGYMDYVLDNGNYYGFIVNNSPGGLVRLDFGNDLRNMPNAVYLGNFGGIISNSAQGIQVVKNNGTWYAIIVTGDPQTVPATPSRILKVDFGTSLTNPSPVATNWGNIGNMDYPHDLYIFQDNTSKWFGLTVSYRNSTITRFSFGSDFSSPPTGVNLGNIGNLNGPTGICPINDNGVWRVFITNFNSHTLSRVDFGNSLLNLPTGSVNLGNPGSLLKNPRDLYLFNNCNQYTCYVASNDGTMARLDFPSLTVSPQGTSLGTVPGAANLHSISKVFRANNDLYTFTPSSNSNNLVRVMFPGCTNSIIPSSSQSTPAPISYPTDGVYNINLTIDDGLPTQASFCKQIVVVNPRSITVSPDTSICLGDSAQLSAGGAASYSWAPLSGLSAGVVANPKASPSANTIYTLTSSDMYGCVQQLPVNITVLHRPVILKSNDTTICSGGSAALRVSGGSQYAWMPSGGLSDPSSANPVASPVADTRYFITVSSNGCKQTDSIFVKVNAAPVFSIKTSQASVCPGGQTTVIVSGGTAYEWLDSMGVSNPFSAQAIVRPGNITQQYSIRVTDSICKVVDTMQVTVTVYPAPKLILTKSGDVDCSGTAIQLKASGAAQYLWTPAAGLSAATIADPLAQPAQSTTYTVQATDINGCMATDTIRVLVSNTGTNQLYLMPNAFTPNHDNLNDCFGVRKWGALKNLQFYIYNRWGQVIFYTTDPAKCWDGNVNGIQQPAGTYVYMIKAATGCSVIERQGTFLLIR